MSYIERARQWIGLYGARTTPSQHRRRDYFPFFELPAEIRLKIYELVLLDHKIVEGDNRKQIIKVSESYQCPTLLSAFHEARNEGISIYYTNTLFEFEDHTYCIPWLDSLPSQARSKISTIRLGMARGYRNPTSRSMITQQLATHIRNESLGEWVVLEIWLRGVGWSPEPFREWQGEGRGEEEEESLDRRGERTMWIGLSHVVSCFGRAMDILDALRPDPVYRP